MQEQDSSDSCCQCHQQLVWPWVSHLTPWSRFPIYKWRWWPDLFMFQSPSGTWLSLMPSLHGSLTHGPGGNASLRTASVLNSEVRTSMRHWFVLRACLPGYPTAVQPWLTSPDEFPSSPTRAGYPAASSGSPHGAGCGVPRQWVPAESPREAPSPHPLHQDRISSYPEVSMHQGGQFSRNPHGALVWEMSGQPWIYKSSSATGERWQGSQSISIWLTVVSVLTKSALGPSSSLSCFHSSSANGRVMVHSLLLLPAKPLDLSLSNLNLDSSDGPVSAEQLVLRFSSHMASAPEATKSASKGDSPLHEVFASPLMCHLQENRTKLGTNSVCCFRVAESHIRPTSPLLYAAQGKSAFMVP